MKKLFLLAVVPFVLAAADLKLEDLPLKDNYYDIDLNKGLTEYTVGPAFSIEPGEIITVSFKAKAIGKPKEFANIRIGFKQYDEKTGRLLHTIHFNYIDGSDAVLLQSAEKGTQKIVVQNSKWTATVKDAVVGFNTKADHSDIPLLSLDWGCHIKSVIVQPDGTAVAELRSPLGKSYPANTPVRLHTWSGKLKTSWYAKEFWPGNALQNCQFTQNPDQWLPQAKKAQLVITVGRRAAFEGLKLQIEKPVVKKTATQGELF